MPEGRGISSLLDRSRLLPPESPVRDGPAVATEPVPVEPTASVAFGDSVPTPGRRLSRAAIKRYARRRMVIFLDTSCGLEQCQRELGPHLVAGQLVTPLSGRTVVASQWAADNGAFARFDQKRFLALLRRDRCRMASCRFVAVPDVVGSARRTLEVFRRWTGKLNGWPLALVAQDGLEDLDVPWESFSALFVGGTTEWKMSAHSVAVIQAAKALGKWVHVGRVNTPDRLAWCFEVGADSVDGTGLGKYSHMRESLRRAAEVLFDARANKEGDGDAE